MTVPILEAIGVRKHFPGVQALDGVSLTVRAGEVLALVGENGAGKSTLMKILAGIQSPDAGELRLDGRPVRFARVADALTAGIALIHQELNLAENLSVADNLYLGRELTVAGWLRRSAMAAGTRAVTDRVGLAVSSNVRVGSLSPGQRQLVEIARALARDARVLIMDEPTSSLTQKEADRLLEVVADLRQQGVAIVYISHRLGEVQRLADRVTVLRDGKNAGDLDRGAITHEALVRLMVGRELSQFFPRTRVPDPTAPVRLDVRDFVVPGGGTVPVSFQLRGGEIVGMAGLIGAGRTELAETLFGLRIALAGTVLLDGRPVSIRSPGQAVRAGLLLVPEDRRHHGLMLNESVRNNLSLPNLDRLNVLRLVARRREAAVANELCRRMGVRTPGLWQKVGLLSGGNQQKVVLGKWLARDPGVLILDEPTRGVDVGAKAEIYGLMDQLAGQGVAILMISSDLEEILGMSDRALVLHQGRLTGELPRDQLNEQAMMHLMTGGTTPSPTASRSNGNALRALGLQAVDDEGPT